MKERRVRSGPDSVAGADRSLRVTVLGAALNILLVLLKLAAGLAGGSRALMADAAHSTSDLISDFVVVWGIVVGNRPSDDCHHYGHAKVELLAELLLGLILVGAGLGILVDSIGAVLAGSVRTPSIIVLPVAALSVVSKEYLYRITMKEARRTGRSSLVANAWHHRSDALTSVGVLLGATLAVLEPSMAVADPLVGSLVAVVVIRVGVVIGWETGARLVDTAPARDYMARIEGMVLQVPGTRSVRDLKMRYVGRLIAVEVHLGLDPAMSVRDSHSVARAVKEAIMERDGRIFDVMVHVEPEEGMEGLRNGETEKRRNGEEKR